MTKPKRVKVKKSAAGLILVDKEGRALGRLTDMDTQEVSIVDNPANQRRFLVVKNDGEQENQMADSATKEKPGIEAAQSVEGLVIKRGSVRGRIAEAVDRTRRLLKHVEAAAVADGATTSSTVSREIRSCQELILGAVSKSALPIFQTPAELGDLQFASVEKQDSAKRFLGDAIRRLEEISGEIGDQEVMDSGQISRLKSSSNILAGAGLVSGISSVAIADEHRGLVLASLEKNISELVDLHIGLRSELANAEAMTQDQVADLVKSALTPPTMFGGEESINDPEIQEAIKVLRSIATKTEDGQAQAQSIGPGVVAAAIKQVMMILGAVASRLPGEAPAHMANAKDGDGTEKNTPDELLEKLMSVVKNLKAETEDVIVIGEDGKPQIKIVQPKKSDAGTGNTDTGKIGATISADKLARLKSAIKLFKEAVIEAKGGSVSFGKFSQVGAALNAIVNESETVKRNLEASGQDIEDRRTADPSNPNQGSGVQPDLDAVANADDPNRGVAGEGVPQEFVEMLKDLRDKVVELDAKGDEDSAARDKAAKRIEELESELERVRKVRSAPSVTGDDVDDVEDHSTAKQEASYWPADMNSLESTRGGAR